LLGSAVDLPRIFEANVLPLFVDKNVRPRPPLQEVTDVLRLKYENIFYCECTEHGWLGWSDDRNKQEGMQEAKITKME